MKKISITILLFLFCLNTFSQEYKDEISIVCFTASFAKSSELQDWKKLVDANKHIIDIEKNIDVMVAENIDVVPTIKLFNNGTEVKVWKANIMLELEVTRKEIQTEIDELVASKYN
tara:strand:- start:139 stop:486 length:348 start_codon:yes stop_codon:yes gene_type:complete